MAAPARGAFSGHIGFILAAAGSAIGLGNIWMFPFRTGEHGGAAFVLVYLVCVALVGVPLLIAETMIGRSTRRNPVGAFRALRGSSVWQIVGWLGVVTGFVILSYYGVVAGWALEYCRASLVSFMAGGAGIGAEGLFERLMANSSRQVVMQVLFMIGTAVVVSRGIEGGIERASKILMPLLFAFILVLLGYSLTSDGAKQGIDFLLSPRFDELGSVGMLAALGQAFFSLSLGMGAMITYGSYLESDRDIVGAAFSIAAMDTALAILAGLVIFPLVFAFGLEPGAGPGLVFVTLPNVFGLMPGGAGLAAIFFGLLLFAALTSAISLLEVVVSFLVDETRMSRAGATWAAASAITVLGIPSALDGSFLDRVDGIASNWLLPIGGLLIALFAGWVLTDREAHGAYQGDCGATRAYGLWRICICFLAPVAVALILIQSLPFFS